MEALNIPESQEISINQNELLLDNEAILKGMGMQINDADDYLLNLINTLVKKSIKLASPKAGFIVSDTVLFDKTSYSIELSGLKFSLGKTVFSMLKRSTGIIFFAVTIGHELELWSKNEMKAGNALEGLIIDLIASELAESATDFLHNFLDESLANSLYSLSNRYSPGYCNWPVTDQHKLFKVLEDKNCGITLNDSALMSPVKSVSGIIGIGQGMKRIDYKCRLCTDEKCILRRRFEA